MQLLFYTESAKYDALRLDNKQDGANEMRLLFYTESAKYDVLPPGTPVNLSCDVPFRFTGKPGKVTIDLK